MTEGTEKFWYDLGYVLDWRVAMCSIDPDELPDEPLDLKLHPFDPIYRSDLAQLFNRDHDTLIGSVVKPTYRHNKMPGGYRGWYWTNSAGGPVGYIEGSGGRFTCVNTFHKHDLLMGHLTDRIR